MADLITKINNVISDLMKTEITDEFQKSLTNVFDKVKNQEHWKNPIQALEFRFTFENYERKIQLIGLLAMAYTHFHGGYELNRIGKTDNVEIYSKGYYTYIEA